MVTPRKLAMGLGMFSATNSPIAIDFGTSAAKLLQITSTDRPAILAAVGLRVPDGIREDRNARLSYLEKQLPRMLRKGGFKGRRAVCSIPCADTLVQHMQLANTDGLPREEAVRMHLADQVGPASQGMVIRTYDVTEVHREGGAQSEVICFAISRETVMRYVELLTKCKLETVGVHSEVIGMVRAFDQMQEKGSPDKPTTTIYVDIGWSATKVAITHDVQLVFARCIQMGGQQIDKRMAERLGCDVATARAQRISEQVLSEGEAPPAKARKSKGSAVATEEGGGAEVELAELGHALADELSMCVRYHQSLFRGHSIDRMIFLGGESRNITLCQQIAKHLNLPAQLGDPLTRFETKRALRTPGLSLGQPQPGWAVACGLCVAPTDA